MSLSLKDEQASIRSRETERAEPQAEAGAPSSLLSAVSMAEVEKSKKSGK